MISNENENEILIDYSPNSYSNSADFTDVSLSACTSQDPGISFLEDHNYEGLPEKSNHHSCSAPNSCSQFSKPGIIWADLDQFCNVQAETDQDDYRVPVNWRCGEVNLGVPVNLNIHKQKSYQMAQMGGVHISDQWNFAQIPRALGREGSEWLDFECDGAAGQLPVWPLDGHLYNLHSDTASNLF